MKPVSALMVAMVAVSILASSAIACPKHQGKGNTKCQDSKCEAQGESKSGDSKTPAGKTKASAAAEKTEAPASNK